MQNTIAERPEAEKPYNANSMKSTITNKFATLGLARRFAGVFVHHPL
jgi:hypothetical protein